MPDAQTLPNVTPQTPPSGTSWRARRRRRATAGTLEQLRRELWHATRTVGAVLDDPDALPADVCRAANALAALGNAYRAVTESVDLDARVTELERALGRGRP